MSIGTPTSSPTIWIDFSSVSLAKASEIFFCSIDNASPALPPALPPAAAAGLPPRGPPPVTATAACPGACSRASSPARTRLCAACRGR